MSKKYFIDIFRSADEDYEARDEWKNLSLEEVMLVLENVEFEEGAIYCLSEQGGEEDVARWTFDDQSVIECYIAYLHYKEEFDIIND